MHRHAGSRMDHRHRHDSSRRSARALVAQRDGAVRRRTGCCRDRRDDRRMRLRGLFMPRALRDAAACVTIARRSRHGGSTNRRAARLRWRRAMGAALLTVDEYQGLQAARSVRYDNVQLGADTLRRSGSSAARCSAIAATTRSSCTTTVPSSYYAARGFRCSLRI